MSKYIVKHGSGGSALDGYLVEMTNGDNLLWSAEIEDAKKMDSKQEAMGVCKAIGDLGFYAETLFVEEV